MARKSFRRAGLQERWRRIIYTKLFIHHDKVLA
jgi:hypothetical protein